jgi:glutamate dehydrogenase (NADP+)
MHLKNVRRGRIREYADKFGAEFRRMGIRGRSPAIARFPPPPRTNSTATDAKTCSPTAAWFPKVPTCHPLRKPWISFLAAGILYGPGKAANAGGVSTSGLEMSQNSMRLNWSREEVDGRLREIMRNIHRNCRAPPRRFGMPGNYVAGANIAGFTKVADSMLDQGVV